MTEPSYDSTLMAGHQIWQFLLAPQLDDILRDLFWEVPNHEIVHMAGDRFRIETVFFDESIMKRDVWNDNHCQGYRQGAPFLLRIVWIEIHDEVENAFFMKLLHEIIHTVVLRLEDSSFRLEQLTMLIGLIDGCYSGISLRIEPDNVFAVDSDCVMCEYAILIVRHVMFLSRERSSREIAEIYYTDRLTSMPFSTRVLCRTVAGSSEYEKLKRPCCGKARSNVSHVCRKERMLSSAFTHRWSAK